MGEFIGEGDRQRSPHAGHAVGLDVAAPSLLVRRIGATKSLFSSLVVGAGASTYPLIVKAPSSR